MTDNSETSMTLHVVNPNVNTVTPPTTSNPIAADGYTIRDDVYPRRLLIAKRKRQTTATEILAYAGTGTRSCDKCDVRYPDGSFKSFPHCECFVCLACANIKDECPCCKICPSRGCLNRIPKKANKKTVCAECKTRLDAIIQQDMGINIPPEQIYLAKQKRKLLDEQEKELAKLAKIVVRHDPERFQLQKKARTDIEEAMNNIERA